MAIGVITEQGDLGLGYTPISEQEEKTLEQHFRSDNDIEHKSAGTTHNEAAKEW